MKKNKILTLSALVIFTVACSKPVSVDTPATVAPKGKNTTIVAVGDIACSSIQRRIQEYGCKDIEVANLTRNLNPDMVFALGDIQYNDHGYSEFKENFGKYWSSLFPKVKPILGNHEYDQPGAKGFFASWPDVPRYGYYSFDANTTWRVIALNTNNNCRFVYCVKGSDQYRWFESELQKASDKCVMVLGHHPRYSSGVHGDNESVDDVYQLMKKYGVSVYLSGHDHHYERFDSPVPQYVVGTGGKDLRSVKVTSVSSQFSTNDYDGVLFLELDGANVNTRFIATDGVTVDVHTTQCSKG